MEDASQDKPPPPPLPPGAAPDSVTGVAPVNNSSPAAPESGSNSSAESVPRVEESGPDPSTNCKDSLEKELAPSTVIIVREKSTANSISENTEAFKPAASPKAEENSVDKVASAAENKSDSVPEVQSIEGEEDKAKNGFSERSEPVDLSRAAPNNGTDEAAADDAAEPPTETRKTPPATQPPETDGNTQVEAMEKKERSPSPPSCSAQNDSASQGAKPDPHDVTVSDVTDAVATTPTQKPVALVVDTTSKTCTNEITVDVVPLKVSPSPKRFETTALPKKVSPGGLGRLENVIERIKPTSVTVSMAVNNQHSVDLSRISPGQQQPSEKALQPRKISPSPERVTGPKQLDGAAKGLDGDSEEESEFEASMREIREKGNEMRKLSPGPEGIPVKKSKPGLENILAKLGKGPVAAENVATKPTAVQATSESSPDVAAQGKVTAEVKNNGPSAGADVSSAASEGEGKEKELAAAAEGAARGAPPAPSAKQDSTAAKITQGENTSEGQQQTSDAEKSAATVKTAGEERHDSPALEPVKTHIAEKTEKTEGRKDSASAPAVVERDTASAVEKPSKPSSEQGTKPRGVSPNSDPSLPQSRSPSATEGKPDKSDSGEVVEETRKDSSVSETVKTDSELIKSKDSTPSSGSHTATDIAVTAPAGAAVSDNALQEQEPKEKSTQNTHAAKADKSASDITPGAKVENAASGKSAESDVKKKGAKSNKSSVEPGAEDKDSKGKKKATPEPSEKLEKDPKAKKSSSEVEKSSQKGEKKEKTAKTKKPAPEPETKKAEQEAKPKPGRKKKTPEPEKTGDETAKGSEKDEAVKAKTEKVNKTKKPSPGPGEAEKAAKSKKPSPPADGSEKPTKPRGRKASPKPPKSAAEAAETEATRKEEESNGAEKAEDQSKEEAHVKKPDVKETGTGTLSGEAAASMCKMVTVQALSSAETLAKVVKSGKTALPTTPPAKEKGKKDEATAEAKEKGVKAKKQPKAPRSKKTTQPAPTEEGAKSETPPAGEGPAPEKGKKGRKPSPAPDGTQKPGKGKKVPVAPVPAAPTTAVQEASVTDKPAAVTEVAKPTEVTEEKPKAKKGASAKRKVTPTDKDSSEAPAPKKKRAYKKKEAPVEAASKDGATAGEGQDETKKEGTAEDGQADKPVKKKRGPSKKKLAAMAAAAAAEAAAKENETAAPQAAAKDGEGVSAEIKVPPTVDATAEEPTAKPAKGKKAKAAKPADSDIAAKEPVPPKKGKRAAGTGAKKKKKAGANPDESDPDFVAEEETTDSDISVRPKVGERHSERQTKKQSPSPRRGRSKSPKATDEGATTEDAETEEAPPPAKKEKKVKKAPAKKKETAAKVNETDAKEETGKEVVVDEGDKAATAKPPTKKKRVSKKKMVLSSDTEVEEPEEGAIAMDQDGAAVSSDVSQKGRKRTPKPIPEDEVSPEVKKKKRAYNRKKMAAPKDVSSEDAPTEDSEDTAKDTTATTTTTTTAAAAVAAKGKPKVPKSETSKKAAVKAAAADTAGGEPKSQEIAASAEAASVANTQEASSDSQAGRGPPPAGPPPLTSLPTDSSHEKPCSNQGSVTESQKDNSEGLEDQDDDAILMARIPIVYTGTAPKTPPPVQPIRATGHDPKYGGTVPPLRGSAEPLQQAASTAAAAGASPRAQLLQGPQQHQQQLPADGDRDSNNSSDTIDYNLSEEPAGPPAPPPPLLDPPYHQQYPMGMGGMGEADAEGGGPPPFLMADLEAQFMAGAMPLGVEGGGDPPKQRKKRKANRIFQCSQCPFIVSCHTHTFFVFQNRVRFARRTHRPLGALTVERGQMYFS